MKSFACSELGGACDCLLSGNTLGEILAKFSIHVNHLVRSDDKRHTECLKQLILMQDTQVGQNRNIYLIDLWNSR